MKFKNNKKIIIITFIFVLLSVNGFAFEKVGTTSFQFLKVMTDARSTGMGEAYSAVTNTSAAVFWNPAALAKVENMDMSVSYLDWLLDITHSSFSFAYTLLGVGTFGIQGLYTDVGEIEETRVSDLGFIGDTYNPGLTGRTFSPGSLVLGLSYARSLTDKFTFGLTAKFVQEDLYVKKVSTMMFDGGLTFQTGFRSLELAAVVRHFGQEIKYYDQGYPLPQTFTIGISGYLIAEENHFLLPSNHHSLLFAFDLSQPRDYDQQYHVGLEYSLRKFIFLRGGYKMNFDQEGPSAGFGLCTKGIRVDYSYCDFGEYFDAVHRFTIGFNFKK